MQPLPHWTQTQRELWDRIRRFDLNAECPANARRQFLQKLADEQNWSLARARRVVEEYRRFAFLAATVDHGVSPPDAVDQAWHQHILDTRSYWQRFCPEVLGRPLHHVPSRGTPEEASALADSYARTVASYRAFFGQEPPPDIWPPPAERARLGDGHYQRLDRTRHWVIEKAALAASLRQFAVAVLILLPLAGLGSAVHRLAAGELADWLDPVPTVGSGLRTAAEVDTHPLDWSGPRFIVFFVLAYLVMLAVAGLLRRILRRPNDIPDPASAELGLYETALLAGREPAVVATAVVALQERRVLRLNPEGNRLQLNGDGALLDKPKHPIEQAIVHSVEAGAGTASELQSACRHELEELQTRLMHEGLLVPDAEAWTARSVPLGTALLVPLLGAMKIDVGVARDKPVGFMVALVAFGALLALIFFLTRPFRSRRGDRVLEILQTRHAALQNPARASMENNDPAQPATSAAVPIALGVALFGTAVLMGSGYEPMRGFLLPLGGGGDSGWSSGCGSDSDSGGGDGGGGGGCGGCGGGGD